MRVVILGGSGQLGSELLKSMASHHPIALNRADVDVTEHDRVRQVVSSLQPEVLINTTAYHRVDDCETRPSIAFEVNAAAVQNLCRLANQLDAKLVHVSTDYVFDGESSRPYVEGDVPRPKSTYGASKYAGELIVSACARTHVLIRTCGLYGGSGSRGKGGNFVETMLRKASAGEPLRVVNDQTVTPTYAADLADQISTILDTGHTGLFHASAEGSCTWFEFAQAIFTISGVHTAVEPASSREYATAAVRPRYSVLENARLKDLGIHRMRHWREGLADYLRKRSLPSA